MEGFPEEVIFKLTNERVEIILERGYRKQWCGVRRVKICSNRSNIICEGSEVKAWYNEHKNFCNMWRSVRHEAWE